jgi:hypothetical protein
MKRRLLNGLSVMAGTLLLGALVLWFVSHQTHHIYTITYMTRTPLAFVERALILESADGGAGALYRKITCTRPQDSNLPPGWYLWHASYGVAAYPSFGERTVAGIGVGLDDSPGRALSTWIFRLTLPYRLICGAFSVPTFVALNRLIQRCRRKASGRCVNCGYDLRASPERCPECGAECGAVDNAHAAS